MVAAMLGDAQSKAEKKRDLQVKFEEFCTDSSLSAISRAYSAKNRMKRYIWVILFIAAMTIISIQTYYVVTKYFSYPSETTIELTFTPEIEFPAVTLCNLNPIRMSAIARQDSPFFVFREPPNPMNDPLYSRMSAMNDATTSAPGSQFTTTMSAGGGAAGATTTSSGGGGGGDATTTSSGGAGGGSATTTSSGGGGGGGATTTSSGGGGGGSVTTTSPPGGGGTTTPPSGKSGRKKRSTSTSGDFNRWDLLAEKDTAKSFYGKKNERFEKEQEFAAMVASMGLDKLETVGHQLSTFLSDCSWAGYPCSPANFTTFQNYKYGNCFTFNSAHNGEEIKSSNRAGSLYGLAVEIFIEQSEYVAQFSQEAGVRVVIHQPGTMAFPEDEGFNVRPGASTALGLKKVAITRLPAPHGECVKAPNTPTLYSEQYNTTYSKTACVKSCYQQNVIRQCDCAMAEYPIPSNVSVCNESVTLVAECHKNVTEYYKAKKLGCDEMCLLPCDDTEYEIMVSSSVWPSQAYEGQLTRKLELGSSKMKMHAGKSTSQNNMVKIEVYYREMTFQNITQNESYQIANVLSDIGGTFGLWLGLSAISVCEFLEFVLSVCAFRRKKNDPQRSQTPVNEISILQDAFAK